MRKLFISVIMALVLGMGCATAQTVNRQGTEFSSAGRSGIAKDTLATKFTWKDSKGNKYPIILNKKSGACYIWKKSGKTGKMYKQYMKEELCQEVCREYGITRQKKIGK